MSPLGPERGAFRGAGHGLELFLLTRAEAKQALDGGHGFKLFRMKAARGGNPPYRRWHCGLKNPPTGGRGPLFKKTGNQSLVGFFGQTAARKRSPVHKRD